MNVGRVFLHSLGSLWIEKQRRDGSAGVWNTTGIFDGRALRPRSKQFGLIALGRAAHSEFLATGTVGPGVWAVDAALQGAEMRKLLLICRAGREIRAEWYLATLTDRMIGQIDIGAIDPTNAFVLSHSAWRGREEVQLLSRPFMSISGTRGTATLIPETRSCRWRIREWARQ